MPVLIRTNYCTAPFPANLGEWSYALGTTEASTSSYQSTLPGPDGLNGFARQTVSTAKTAGESGPYRNEAGKTGGAGDNIPVRIAVRSSVGITVHLRISAYTAGSVLVSVVDLPDTVLAANTWTVLSGTLSNIAGTYGFIQVFVVQGATAILPVGATFDNCRCVIGDSGSFFDGSHSPNAPYKTTAWTGAVNASSSTESSVLDLPADSYSLNDIELRYWKARSGLGLGYSLQDYKSAAIKSILALSNLSISDLEWNYWKSLSGLANGSVQDHREKVTNYNDRAYYASFFK